MSVHTRPLTTLLSHDEEMDITYDAPTPVWEQVARDVAAQIRAGTWRPGQRMMSEHDLTTTYGIARGTARRVVVGLVEWGYVFVVPRRGTFVNEREHWKDV